MCSYLSQGSMFLQSALAVLCAGLLCLGRPRALTHRFHFTHGNSQQYRRWAGKQTEVYEAWLRAELESGDAEGSLNRLNSLLLPQRRGVPACCLLPVPARAATMHSAGTCLVLLWAGSRHSLRNRADSKKQRSHSSICLARFSSPYPSIHHPKSVFS